MTPRPQPLRFAWEQAIRKDRAITGTAKLVLFIAASYGNLDGSGITVSVETLAADTGKSVSAVQRAIAEGRASGYLIRARRGHRLGDGTAAVSIYRLALPSQPQPVTGDRLRAAPGDVSTGQNGGLNRSKSTSQPVTHDRLPEVLPKELPLAQPSAARVDFAKTKNEERREKTDQQLPPLVPVDGWHSDHEKVWAKAESDELLRCHWMSRWDYQNEFDNQGSPEHYRAWLLVRFEEQKRARAERERQEAQPATHEQLFDALADACGVDVEQLTGSRRGRLHKATKELVDVGATVKQVSVKAATYREQHPNWMLTETALVQYWPTLSSSNGHVPEAWR
jgi:hypothetical protein